MLKTARWEKNHCANEQKLEKRAREAEKIKCMPVYLIRSDE